MITVMVAPVDVVIITAVEGGDTVLLEVSEGALSGWINIPTPDGYASDVLPARLHGPPALK